MAPFSWPQSRAAPDGRLLNSYVNVILSRPALRATNLLKRYKTGLRKGYNFYRFDMVKLKKRPQHNPKVKAMSMNSHVY